MILIVPDWIGPGDESVLRQNLTALSQLSETGTLFKIDALPESGIREAAYLGLDPRSVGMKQGPLTVAAFGADPPARSVHFHLSLMSFDGESGHPIEVQIPEDELRLVMEAAKRLNTSKLTIVEGTGVDHGLVWEDGSIDLHAYEPGEIGGKPFRSVLPEGDGEPLLRRFIDDSTNLLSGLPLNEERRAEELPPLNLLWPWGQGFREPVPNLMLKRGEQALVESASLRLQGLARLANYRHGSAASLGSGVNVRLEHLREVAEREPLLIVVLDSMAELRKVGKLEEMSWLGSEIDRRLLAPLLAKWALDTEGETRLSLLSPASEGGLGLEWSSRTRAENVFPFDERSLDERRLERRDLWTAVADGLRPVGRVSRNA